MKRSHLTGSLLLLLVFVSFAGCRGPGRHAGRHPDREGARAGGREATSRAVGPEQTLTDTITPAPKCENKDGSLYDKRIFFDGKCRKFAFFERFLSPGASLLGVGGPKRWSSDSGVIVYESTTLNQIQELYLLPDKLDGAAPLNTGYLYRADYPLVAARAHTTWTDAAGFVQQLILDQGPVDVPGKPTPKNPNQHATRVFGTVSWATRTQTASGWIEVNSAGVHSQQIAQSGGSGDYCNEASTGADMAATTYCMGGFAVSSLAAGLASGIVSGVAVSLMGAGFTTPEGIAVAVGTGGAVTAAGVASGTVICSSVGDFVGAVASDYCKSAPTEADPDDIKFAPLFTGVYASENGGTCPAGMVLYTGSVISCGSSPAVITLDDGSEVDGSEVVCDSMSVKDACVLATDV